MQQRFLSCRNVFGQLGARVRSVRKAWATCVLRAHGYTPTWGTSGTLSASSRAALRGIDLQFHDVRHEAGCRWLEAGWPIHHVQEMLGHASLAQTATYLHSHEMGLRDSMCRFDAAAHQAPAEPPLQTVADQGGTEHRPVGNDQSENAAKDRLH